MKKFIVILSLLLLAGVASAQPTQINGNQIKDQAITNAKINNAAAIHYSKINFTGIPPSVLGLEAPLTFNAPLTKIGLTVSLSPVNVPLGGTGLTTVAAGLIPFGNTVNSLNTSPDFQYDNANDKLSLVNLKVSGGSPSAGFVLTATDGDGNLAYTDPVAIIPTNTIIPVNEMVVGTGTSITSYPALTFDGSHFLFNNSVTYAIEDSGPTRNNISSNSTVNTDVYEYPNLYVLNGEFNSTIEGSSLVSSYGVASLRSTVTINKPTLYGWGLDSLITVSKPMTNAYPVIGITSITAGGTITNAYGLVGRVAGDGGDITNAYGVAALQPILSAAGTISKAAALMVGPPSSIPGSPIYATDQTWALIGTRTIPAGNWAIYSASAYPSYFTGIIESTGFKLATGAAVGKVFVSDASGNGSWSATPTVSAVDFAIAGATGAERRLTWNNTDGTLDLGLKGGATTLQLGQETLLRVYNNTGSPLSDGQVVYVTGSQGSSRVTVGLAKADSLSTLEHTVGIVTEPIGTNDEGFITTYGFVRGFDTNALTEGAIVYVSPTVAGGLTTTKPAPPNIALPVGVCIRKNASTGILGVAVERVEEYGHTLYVQQVTTTKAPATTEISNVFTNEGDADGATINLPTASAGLTYTVYVQTAQTFTITAAAGDTIRIDGSVTAAAGSISSNVVGSSITLVAINATEWVALSTVGTWVF